MLAGVHMYGVQFNETPWQQPLCDRRLAACSSALKPVLRRLRMPAGFACPRLAPKAQLEISVPAALQHKMLAKVPLTERLRYMSQDFYHGFVGVLMSFQRNYKSACMVDATKYVPWLTSWPLLNQHVASMA